MAAPCNRKNPLTRSGTNQAQRYRRALEATHFGIDERSTADLIRFAARYGRHVRFYNSSNAVAGDWEPFFNTDVSAILAGLSHLPVISFRAFSGNLQAFLARDPARPPDVLSAHFKLLLHLPLLLLRDAGTGFDRLPLDHALRDTLHGIMTRNVDEPLRSLVAYHKGAIVLADPPISDVSLFENTPLDPSDYNISFDDADPRIQLPSSVAERIDGLPPFSLIDFGDKLIDEIAPAGWPAYYSAVAADTTPYEDSIGSSYDQIYDALNFNLLDSALEQLYQSLERVTIEAASFLDRSLTDHDHHTPHYGLWLAFLRLFKQNQAHLNTLVGQHLDYYYRDVLRLCSKASRPDRVHLLFELHKQVDEHLLKSESTVFRAGKDALGREILYQLDEDFVVNRAQIDTLKAVYRSSMKTTKGPSVIPYAADPPNSRNGLGEELPKENPMWTPFGLASAAPYARVGFAVADRRLFMREGKRTVYLVLKLDAALTPGLYSSAFRASFTTEDGWLDIQDPARLIAGSTAGMLLFIISVDGTDPAVVPYDEAVHGDGFHAAEPVLKIEFRFDDEPELAGSVLSRLSGMTVASFVLAVGASDLRDFTLANESGAIDPSKPFLPFGPTPEKNAPLFLGSSELFSKELTSATLHTEWAERMHSGFFKTPTAGEHQVRIRRLEKGAWTGAGAAYDTDLFPTSGPSRNLVLSNLAGYAGTVPQSLENPTYTPQSQTGFLKFELDEGFGHRQYLDAKTLALIDKANGGTSSLPDDPYTPKINEISLSYVTSIDPPARFIHLHPFGAVDAPSEGSRLLPVREYEGELFIGVAYLRPPQRLSLLFQIVDGTANPLKSEAELEWHYLRGDSWVAFKEQDVDDKTRNLTRSGIVRLAVPGDADTEHGILPGGYHWIRMAAPSDSDALNALLTIDAQAAGATFVDRNNAPDVLDAPRAAGSISKMKESSAAVKRISQPYASFGGRPPEKQHEFTVRASERLRHKNRAVTMWDYEHLILEEFPAIYRARCINHTELVRDVNNDVVADNEVRPGHVLVVTLPYIRPESATNPLRPYTDKKTLGDIDLFLRERLSPFVELEVQNPKFEEVQVKFRVAFRPKVADIAFYSAELNQAIIRYLSPWAYEDGFDISFGGKWHKSAIVDFIEEQTYVDYVTDVAMYHKADETLGDSEWPRIDEEVAAATTSRSVLVSHPAHIIIEITEEAC